ncbi:DNA/RNA non-specific endonuclease, partial [Ralstonia pseudosolanacearum]|uniref:DNA/RNA non-specific endonuclease n=1 Tax=Ralstonia pseudosolanacearum TaxID=1310165 RepID=UPI003CF261D1
MMNWSDKHSVRADRWYAPLAVFLLIYPVLTVLKQGSASALLIAAGVLSLGAGVAVRRALSGPATPEGADRLVRLTGWALCMPLAAVILSEAWAGIEKATRKYVLRAHGDVYVITGPVFVP